MSSIDPRETIVEVLGGLVAMDPPPRAMDPELAPWHVLFEHGHNIVTALDTGDLGEDPSTEALRRRLLPAPVKMLERTGWRVVKGFVVARLPHDPTEGLIVPPEDEEYVQEPATSGGSALAVYEVGKPYPTRLPWQSGGVQITVTAKNVDFVLPLSGLSDPEVRAFRKGNAEFAIIAEDRYTLWLYRFTNPTSGNPAARGPGISWADAPWEYHRQALLGQPPAPPGDPGSTFPLQLVLVEADTGIVRGLRLLNPPVQFADAVRAAVARQAQRPNEIQRADAEIERLYARYPNSAALLPLATARFEALRDGTAGPRR
ncbi:hypothetical protein [Streptomyces nanshensis]|uniref:hypothetical protein n=1 Tax=Streptomyces nanshensis TaxID=518642 RepID=UPI00085CA28F|nr:hypothetical protein [Streptomyces nanshensis]